MKLGVDPGAKYRIRVCYLINEMDAQDRSIEHCGEGMAVDESLEEICMLLRQEARRATKKSRVAVAA
jgi:hypothetical protein